MAVEPTHMFVHHLTISRIRLLAQFHQAGAGRSVSDKNMPYALGERVCRLCEDTLRHTVNNASDVMNPAWRLRVSVIDVHADRELERLMR